MHRYNKNFGPFWAMAAECGPHQHEQHQHQHRPGPWGNPWEHRGSHHRGGGPGGPPPWLAGLFGMGRPEGQRGARVRRGDVRFAILDVLRAAQERDESLNGYQVIQQITDRSGGAWRPSPGSVYPTVSQLEDEGLVETEGERSRRSLQLTEAGSAYCVDNADELAAVWTPFDRAEADGPGDHADIKAEIPQVMSAVWQIAISGDAAQRSAAVEVLVDARRRLYGILADGPAPEGTDEGDDA
ncbi:PadR family transcriptional regulator [Nocardioides humilatus]|uniref:PadR family transcriptional regulator n=1 Tax=Nocardioides humilatus TaxID=2607660 RepID=A0A5B1L6Y8_9ACTN|nr:PadR family transcriptional regulator [Nocardioides humilatus]KAA1415489.1 PadR family transcriptional regulator [Nocardioides humilatus]